MRRLAEARYRLVLVLRKRVPQACPWCGTYDGPCFHCGRCADCGALEGEEHRPSCYWVFC